MKRKYSNLVWALMTCCTAQSAQATQGGSPHTGTLRTVTFRCFTGTSSRPDILRTSPDASVETSGDINDAVLVAARVQRCAGARMRVAPAAGGWRGRGVSKLARGQGAAVRAGIP